MTIDRMTLKTLVEKGSDDDLLREMLSYIANRMMDLEVESLTGDAHGERSPTRTNHRNGYRERAWETRAGTFELEIPKLRKGSYFPVFLSRTTNGRLARPATRAWKSSSSSAMIHRPSRVASRRLDERPGPTAASGHDRRSYTTSRGTIAPCGYSSPISFCLVGAERRCLSSSWPTRSVRLAMTYRFIRH